MFATIKLMDNALELLDLAIAGVAMFPPSRLLDDELSGAVVGVQRHIDRLKVLHSRLLNEADRRRLWAAHGYRNAGDWLAGSTNTSKGDAHSRARLGAALGASDALSAAAQAGDVSAATAESLFDAVTDRPDDANDADIAGLVDACKGANPADARDAAEKWKSTFASETAEQAEARRYAKRSLTSKKLGDGMSQFTLVAPTIDVRQVLNAASHIAGKPCQGDGRTTEQRLADGVIQLGVAYAKGEVAGGRENPSLLITITAESYTGSSQQPGRTAHGDEVPAHVVRFLTEQARMQRVLLAGSHVLDLGRQVRFATEHQYKALVARDGGCRWPGCTIPAAWCDADHLHDFDHGGHTDLNNLVLWCRHHHTVKHSPGVQVHGDAHNLRVQLADGTVVSCPPKGAAARQRSQAAA